MIAHVMYSLQRKREMTHESNVVVLPLAILVLLSVGAHGQTTNYLGRLCATGTNVTGTLSVKGKSNTKIVPDSAFVTVRVVATNASAQAARNEAAAAWIAAERKLENLSFLNESDIKTMDVNLRPNYIYIEGKSREISNYTFTQQVQVAVKESSDVGIDVAKVIDATIPGKKENVFLDGTFFSPSDGQMKGVLDDLLAEAVANGLSNAQIMANAAGAKLGAVTSLRDDAYYVSPSPAYYSSSADTWKADAPGLSAESETSVSPGEETVSAEVSIDIEMCA
eukprot:jgi/Picsp_1/1291/NSC_04772-R1_outer membrane protein